LGLIVRLFTTFFGLFKHILYGFSSYVGQLQSEATASHYQSLSLTNIFSFVVNTTVYLVM